ncbi:hypothetical protein ENSA5_48190 [Enhygromyxa salina]|uniref:4Fe-4S ferredoxin-type domain-containing protein n=1 Tax=Enhygromyxa salina TaxID=215803 RepID=A0A2S9XIH6_9BACT|nr:hypothetical protein [Enhygromyxa salina]PRP92637.1 hypothetical protein ENSA5_48190 [Enhygromyxa salina]
MASSPLRKIHFAALSLASVLGFGLGACVQDPGTGTCAPGTLNCECNVGQCYPGLQCVANFCIGIPGGDGDGDGETGDGTDDPECPTGELSCDGACIDPDVDPDNCGECGNACEGVCNGGVCEIVDCTVEACPDGSYCDLGTNECMPGCGSDADCPDGSCDLGSHTCGLGAGDACDVYTQDCIDGFKCNASYDPPICTQLPPAPKQVGQPCELAEDDCVGGAYCMYSGDPNVGTCNPVCGGSEANPTCDLGEFCAMTAPPLCFAQCDPLADDCAFSEGCYGLTANMEFGCIPTSVNLGLGESCAYLNDCESGLGCNTNGVCAEFCAVDNPPVDCTCVELFNGIGLCT